MPNFFILLVVIPSLAFGASFNCDKSSSLSEMMICNDSDLSRLDDELNIIYKKAKAKATNQTAFIQQTKSTWAWREKNCHTKECLLNWYINRKQILGEIPNKNNSISSYNYDIPIVLKGVLVTSVADASITISEKPEAFPALRLQTPITVNCTKNDDKYCQSESGVVELQLVLRSFDSFKKLKNKSATVHGSLFHSDNGHHLTKILLDVKSISP